MQANETSVQWNASEIGASMRIARMAADYYPFDKEAESPRVASTVRLTVEQHQQVKFVADVWNAFDKARGVKRAKKWKPAAVIERFVSIGLDGFADQIGGWPSDETHRRQLIKNAADVAAVLESRRKK